MKQAQAYELAPGYFINRAINGCWQLSLGHSLNGALDMQDVMRAFRHVEAGGDEPGFLHARERAVAGADGKLTGLVVIFEVNGAEGTVLVVVVIKLILVQAEFAVGS